MEKYIGYISLFLICLCQCSLKNANVPQTPLVKVSVVYKVPSLYTKDSAFLAKDSSCIYYYGKYRVHEIPLGKGHFLDTGEFIEDSITVSYFGYDTTKKIGFKVEYLTEKPLKNATVDSFLMTRPVASTLNQLLAKATFDKEVKVSDDVFLKRYALDYEGADSFYLYYDKSLADLPFSFSQYQDSLGKSKLSRIELTLKKDTSRNAVQFNQFRKVSWELRRSPADRNFSAIIDFCNKMEASYNN